MQELWACLLAAVARFARRVLASLRPVVALPRNGEGLANWHAVAPCVDLDSARLDAVSRSLQWGLGVTRQGPLPAVHRAYPEAPLAPLWYGRPPEDSLRFNA
jgi:hypothetical protein